MDETQTQSPETQSETPPFSGDLARTIELAGYYAEDSGTENGPIRITGEISDLSEEELKAQLVHSLYDYQHRNFSDLFRNNAAKNELRRLQLLKARQENPAGFDDRELVVTQQASTYHQYFPEVLNATVRSTQKYEAAVVGVPAAVRAEMAPMEGYAKTYLGELNTALNERLLYANILTLADHIHARLDPNGAPLAEQDVVTLKGRLETLLADPKLSETTKTLLGGTVDGVLAEVAKQGDIGLDILANNLNQRLIEILGGKCGHGVPDDFTPMVLELELIRRHYDFVFSKESELSMDARLTRATARMKVLQAEHEMAEQNGTEFPKEKAEESAAIQRQIDDRNAELDALKEQRRVLSNQIVVATAGLGRYQMKMAGITTVQNMFGDLKDVPSLTAPLPDQTPDVVRESINRNMEARGDFHLQTMGDFLGVVENDVLGIDLSVRVEDLSNRTFRPFMHKLTGGIANVITIFIPEMGQFKLRTNVKNSLTGELDRALGWPPGKTDFEELTDDEKANVRKKAQTIYQAILEFKYAHTKDDAGNVDFGPEYKEKEEIVNFKDTMAMVKGMPPASAFVEGVPDEGALDKRVTRADYDMFMSVVKPKIDAGIALTQPERDAGATMYLVLFTQLNNDWGEIDPPSGFIGEYAGLMRDIDDNIGTHFATASALSEISAKFFSARDILLVALIAALGVRAVMKVRRYLRGNPVTALEKQVATLTGERTALAAENTALRSSLSEAERLAASQTDELTRNTTRIVELEQEVTRLTGQGQEALEQIAQKQDEIARLTARTLELEEALVKAGSIQARRTATLARVAEFVDGPGAQVMSEIATNQRAISATEATIREIMSLPDEAARLARAAELSQAQATLGQLLRADRTARISAARTLLGEGVTLSDEAAELIWRAHIAESLPSKVKLLREAMTLVYGTAPEQLEAVKAGANLLARSGIAGDVAVVLERSANATKAAPGMALRLMEMGLPETSETIIRLSSNPRNFRFLNEAFEAGGKEGAARVTKYLAALGEGAQEALTDPSLVRTVLASGDDAAKLGMTMAKLGTQRAFTAAECLTMADELVRFKTVGPRALGSLQTTMLIAGPILEAAMVGYDIYELVQARERRDEEIKSMVGALDQMVSQGLMTKEGDIYKGPGCQIDVKQISAMTGAEEEAQWARTAVDGAALIGTTATTIVVLSGAAGPPGLAAGLIVAGVIITVHVGISTVEGSIDQYRRSEFLKAAPPWLIALMGPEGLVGKTTEDVIREHTGTMRSEYMPRSWGEAALTFNPITGPAYSGVRGIGNTMNAEQIEQEKQEVRDKSMQALAYRSFAASHPEFVSELPSGGNVQELLIEGSDFLKPGGDYERIVKPLITLQLQAAARPGLVGISGVFGYESNPDMGAIQTLVLPERSQLDASAVGVRDEADLLERAGSRAMTFYVHHIRQQRYRDAIAAIEEDTRYDGEYKTFLIEQYDQYIDENKSHEYVFNVHPKTLSRSGPTLAEKLVAEHALTPEKLRLFGDDTVSAAEAAAMGYSFPNGLQNMSLLRFLDVYVEPDHTKETEQRLESYSAAHNDLPFDFQTMENLKTDEDFEATVGRAIDRAKSVNDRLSQPGFYRNDADLRQAFDAIPAEDLRLFEGFDKHKDFYNMYLTRWRRSERYVMSYSEPWVTMLMDWKEQGYPALIDEVRFSAVQKSLLRPADKPLDVRSSLSWLRGAEQALPGFTYDPERPNRILSTYSTFMSDSMPVLENSFANPFEELLNRNRNPFNGFERGMRENRERFNRRENALARLRADQERMEKERNLRVRDGSAEGRPLNEFQNLTTSIAVEDKYLTPFMQSWAKNDGFDALRADMLSRRVFVISDPIQPPQILLDLERP